MELSYTSGNVNPEKIYYVFSKERFSYTSGNGNLEKILYISGNGKPLKNFLYFRKRNFFAPSLKYFLCFRKNFQSPKN